MAKMIHDGLFVGSSADVYKFAGSILHCAKEPWFSTAESNRLGRLSNMRVEENGTVIRIDYNEMALNFVDAKHDKYFQDETFNAGLDFITERMAEGDPVLVHCNMGASRGPSVAFLWMFEHGFLDDEFQYAVSQFQNLYPGWCPGNGIWQYLKNRCDRAPSIQ